MSKESFKSFVRIHPELTNFVNNNQMTWQKFYDMYDLYGEDNSVWEKYFSKSGLSDKTGSIKELLQMIRSVDLDSVQKGISGIEKAIGLIKDLGIGIGAKEVGDSITKNSPKPMYQYFDD